MQVAIRRLEVNPLFSSEECIKFKRIIIKRKVVQDTLRGEFLGRSPEEAQDWRAVLYDQSTGVRRVGRRAAIILETVDEEIADLAVPVDGLGVDRKARCGLGEFALPDQGRNEVGTDLEEHLTHGPVGCWLNPQVDHQRREGQDPRQPEGRGDHAPAAHATRKAHRQFLVCLEAVEGHQCGDEHADRQDHVDQLRHGKGRRLQENEGVLTAADDQVELGQGR